MNAAAAASGPASFAFLRDVWYARPVPAGIRRPTITFSFSPRRSSFFPMIAASVSTRVVSWNDAAEMNESVDSDALVMPSSMWWNCAGSLPSLMARSFSSSNSERSTCSSRMKRVSPGSVITTRRSIWRTITSMCLSLILTPCSR